LNFSLFFLLGQPSLTDERIKLVCFQVSNLHTIHKPRRTDFRIVMAKLHFKKISKFSGFQSKYIFLLSMKERIMRIVGKGASFVKGETPSELKAFHNH